MELVELIKKQITEINELLYCQNLEDAYPLLVQFLPNLEKYICTLSGDDQMEWMEFLKTALEAMEEKDATLLADILEYEILERLK